MKNMLVVLIALVMFPLTFALKANGQTVSTETVISTGSVIAELAKANPLVKTDKNGVAVKEPKFSISIGLGSGYNFGIKEKGSRRSLQGYRDNHSFSGRVGYSPWKYVEVQGEYSKNSGFQTQRRYNTYAMYNIYPAQNITFAFTTFTVNLKVKVPISVKDVSSIKDVSFSPYVIGGIGRVNTRYVNDYQVLVNNELRYEQNWKYLGSGKAFKLGGGVDVKLYKNLYALLEYNYWEVVYKQKGFDGRRHAYYYYQTMGGMTLKF